MTTARGIVSYGAYLPFWRLRRSAIGAALGTKPGRGTRTVASYDEDTTSMAVEAARIALRGCPAEIGSVLFATAAPAYQDKTNATAIGAALSLGSDILAADAAGAVRSGTAAIHAGLRGDAATLVLLSDMRNGLPGSAEEREGGDGAAALVLGNAGSGPLIAEYLGGASVSGEFLDRWRGPGELRSQVWEERFGETSYVPLAARALTNALRDAGLSADQLDRVVVAGLHARAVRGFIKAVKLGAGQVVDDLAAAVGNTGTAQPGIGLSAALDVAAPGDLIALVVLADGADVLLFRATSELLRSRSTRPLSAQVSGGRDDLPYAKFLTWRGYLEQEPPRRPDPDRPGPPARRMERWKYGFTGSRCECGQVHLPPQRVCVGCGLVDHMTGQILAEVPATVATYTVDRLAFSMSPPIVAAVLDFDGGGRFTSELTDVDPAGVTVGTRVEMTFRRLYTAGGVHNYFWKARPLAGEETR